MNKLDIAREQINEIDKQMAALFEKRMLAAEMVADYKRENGLPIYDASREEAVIEKNSAYINKDEIKKYYANFQHDVMKISRNYQSSILNDIKFVNNTEIILERGALKKADKFFNLNRKVLIVTDNGVPSCYSQTVAALCCDPVIVTVEQGEGSKSFETLQSLCSAMVENSFTRKDCVVAVGGGVAGDLAGFAAASYMRGIDFYNIPTTVLSQVDASIGGKVAINFEGIKNIIGAFYHPKCVLIDPEVLKTLPARQISNGLAEAVKMGLTSDKELFKLFESAKIDENIDEIIIRCLKIKRSVVEQDENEKGLRKILNFGHTIGHGIESAKMGELYHGECVALGMLYMCSDTVRARLIKVLKSLNLPTEITFNKQEIIDAISHDKKSDNNKISVIFVNGIGSFEILEKTVSELGDLL